MSATTLQDLRRELPAGPEQRSTLDTITDHLTAATGFDGLPDKLQRWGWTDELGRSVPWQRWHTNRWGR